MARFISKTSVFILLLMLAGSVDARTFTEVNGNVTEGELSTYNEDGIVVLKTDGQFSNRIDWINLSEETIVELVREAGPNSDLAFYADPFLPPPDGARQILEIRVNDVPTVDRPDGDSGFFGSLMSPIGIVILGGLIFANIYAGYEVAAYRNQNPALVCAISAVAPIVGPIIFLCIPEQKKHVEEYEEVAEETEAAPASAPQPAAQAGVGVPSGGGLSLSAQPKAASGGGAGAEAQVYSHSDHTFNRNFIETQFAGFFRVVPPPADKDKVIVFKTVKQTYVAKRITRISSNELHLQLQVGAGSKEVRIGISEIVEIQVRHKDAK